MVLFEMLIYDFWYGDMNKSATCAKELKMQRIGVSATDPIFSTIKGHVRSWPERERLDEMTILLILFMPVTMGHTE